MLHDILIGVGIYLAIGFGSIVIFAFYDGLKGKRTDVDTVGALLFWPLFLLAEIVPMAWRTPSAIMEWVNKRGLDVYKHRRQRNEFKALCKKEGWPFRKMWKGQKEKAHAAR